VKDESTIRLERRRVSSTEKDTKSVRNSVNLPMELLPQLIDILREFHAEETGQPRGKDLEDKKLSEDIKKLGLQ